MRMRIREPEDFVSGVIFLGLGLGALWIALGYPMGTAGRMGPGYVPAILGGLLALLGAVITLKCLQFGPADDTTVQARSGITGEIVRLMRPLFFVVTGLLTFALVLPRFGLVAAVVLLVLITAFADHKPRPIAAVPLAIALATATVLIFVHGLGIPLRVWP
jgi:hypothetical protein